MARFKKGLLLILITCICMTSLHMPINVSAKGENTTCRFVVNYPEPYCSDTSGYISVMYSTGSNYRLYTYFWIISPLGDSEYSTNFGARMSVEIHSNQIKFTPIVNSSSDWYYTLACYDWQDGLHILTPSQYYTNSTTVGSTYSDSYSATPISGYIYSGNVQISSYSTLKDITLVPSVIWSSSVDGYLLYNQLSQLFSKLLSIEGDTTQLINLVTQVINQNVISISKLEELVNLITSIHDEDNQQIIYLLEMIEYYLTCPDDSSMEATDNFKENSSSQKNKLDDLNTQSNNKNKVDASESSGSVDSSIDYDAAANYGMVLSVVTGHKKILSMILVVFAIGTISYVLFGKRK